MEKHELHAILIGLCFSALYVGCMVLFPVFWAIVNMIVVLVVLVKITLKTFKK